MEMVQGNPKLEWNSDFLQNENKTKELFSFIGVQIVKIDIGGKLLLGTCTHFDIVLPYMNRDFEYFQPCNYPEADSKILLQLAHALKLAYIYEPWISLFLFGSPIFETLGLSELLVGLGSGKTLL